MQLSFKKTLEGEISVRLKAETQYDEFSYSKMIKRIYDDKEIKDSEMLGDFTEREIISIKELTDELRKAAGEVDDVTSLKGSLTE